VDDCRAPQKAGGSTANTDLVTLYASAGAARLSEPLTLVNHGMNMRVNNRTRHGTILAQAYPETPAQACAAVGHRRLSGPHTSVSQTGRTAPDSGVHIGQLMDPDLQVQIPRYGPDTLL
jgi:hypothetical protein